MCEAHKVFRFTFVVEMVYHSLQQNQNKCQAKEKAVGKQLNHGGSWRSACCQRGSVGSRMGRTQECG